MFVMQVSYYAYVCNMHIHTWHAETISVLLILIMVMYSPSNSTALSPSLLPTACPPPPSPSFLVYIEVTNIFSISRKHSGCILIFSCKA